MQTSTNDCLYIAQRKYEWNANEIDPPAPPPIPFTRNVGPLRVGPERSQRRLVAKFGGDMPHWHGRRKRGNRGHVSSPVEKSA